MKKKEYVFAPSFDENMQTFRSRMADFFQHPFRYNVEPFRIIGNVYYIGDKFACLYLIDTGDGLIMIDTGYPQCKMLYLANIYALGFDPKNIKYILHTHEHWDHWGSTPDMVALYGCKTMMSRAGADALKERPWVAAHDMIDYGYLNPKDLSIDILIDDGDTFTLGNTTLSFKLTPGHAEGVLTIFSETEESGENYRWALLGGATVMVSYREVCERWGIPISIRTDFLRSLERLHGEKVDVVLGNHCRQNDTLGKIKRWKENPEKNPFIDADEWERFLDETHDMVEAFLEFDK